MSSVTDHYNLIKPDLSDLMDVSVIADDMDKIDTQLFEITSGMGNLSHYTYEFASTGVSQFFNSNGGTITAESGSTVTTVYSKLFSVPEGSTVSITGINLYAFNPQVNVAVGSTPSVYSQSSTAKRFAVPIRHNGSSSDTTNFRMIVYYVVATPVS